jgi:uncharacterized protein YbbC (DUF1343 family)
MEADMPVRTGLQVLLSTQLPVLAGQCVGLVTNPTGVLPDLSSTLDALLAAGVQVTALFGPEHGVRASAPDGQPVASAHDGRTSLPVFSLYGQDKRPTAEMARNVDIFLYDIQDVGARFYTYIWTLSHVMESARDLGKRVVVLDRPNPLGGLRLEGALLDERYESLVGRWSIPLRYGLTIGELARWFNQRVGCDLIVVPMQGWQRHMWYDETGLPWVPPSPGMPTLEVATVYPGACLFEGTTMSEGRGTTMPFLWIGAPWIDGDIWARNLNQLGLPGVRFRPVAFTPTTSKHEGLECFGVQIHVTDRDSYLPVRTALHMLLTARRLAPVEFNWLPSSWEGFPPHVDLLAGGPTVREMLNANRSVADIEATWPVGLAAFRAETEGCCLY